jgi:hypothetical protein
MLGPETWVAPGLLLPAFGKKKKCKGKTIYILCAAAVHARLETKLD